MLSRLNFFQIIRDHLKTLRNINSGSQMISRPDCIVFFIMPFIVSIYLVYKEIDLHPHTTDLITAVSILGGFLFNLLAVIYGLMDKLKADSENDTLKSTFVKEIHINISFNILISLMLILLLIIYTYQADKPSVFTTVDRIFSLFIYFFLILFMLTMIMIFNRIYIIMKKEN